MRSSEKVKRHKKNSRKIRRKKKLFCSFHLGTGNWEKNNLVKETKESLKA